MNSANYDFDTARRYWRNPSSACVTRKALRRVSIDREKHAKKFGGVSIKVTTKGRDWKLRKTESTAPSYLPMACRESIRVGTESMFKEVKEGTVPNHFTWGTYGLRLPSGRTRYADRGPFRSSYYTVSKSRRFLDDQIASFSAGVCSSYLQSLPQHFPRTLLHNTLDTSFKFHASHPNNYCKSHSIPHRILSKILLSNPFQANHATNTG